MKRSKAYQEKDKGLVYLVTTPIGNLEDITYRAVRILKESDIIAAEDTRNTTLLLKHYDIHPKKLVSLYSQIEDKEGENLVREVREKNLVLSFCSDAGMPGISDPGALLCRKCHDLDVPVSILPGPTASLSALVLSGIDTADFSFFGFPPTKNNARLSFFEDLVSRKETLIFYESPKRVHETLLSMLKAFGPRQAALVRELSKIHEETILGTLEELSTLTDIKGECVLIVEGSKKEEVDPKTIKKALKSLLDSGMSIKEASKEVATRYGQRKSEVYDLALTMRK